GQEPRVAAPALASLGHEVAQPRGGQVHDHLAAAVSHDGAHGERYLDVLAPRPVSALARPVAAIGGAAKRVVLEAQERRFVLRRDEPDVASVPTVAAVGTPAV